MTIQQLFITSNEALGRVVAQITDDQWELDMPPGSSRKPMKLKAAIQYHTYDDAWVPDVLAGKTADEVGSAYEDLKTAEAVRENYVQYNERANKTVGGFTDLEKITHLTYGDFSAHDYLQHIVSFRALRAHDIAKLIGADTTMDPEYVHALSDEFSPVAESYRQMGVFPAALEVSNDADPQTKLLAMFGRSN